jgi:hypothetical protein
VDFVESATTDGEYQVPREVVPPAIGIYHLDQSPDQLTVITKQLIGGSHSGAPSLPR